MSLANVVPDPSRWHVPIFPHLRWHHYWHYYGFWIAALLLLLIIVAGLIWWERGHSEPAQRICPKCGKLFRATVMKCKKCGFSTLPAEATLDSTEIDD